MSKIKAYDVIKIVVFLLLYRVIATERQGVFDVSYWDKYIYSIICCCIIFTAIVLKNKMKYPISKVEVKLLFWEFLPFLVAGFCSLMITALNPVGYPRYYTRMLSNVMFPLLSILQGLMFFKYFGREAIDLTFFAYTAGYITSVAVAFLHGGLTQFALMIFDSTYNGSVLEMSELSPAFCLFSVYYLYEYNYRKLSQKKMLLREFICLFVLIVGMKRILILASIASLATYLFLCRNMSKIKFWTNFISVALIAVSLLYIYSIKSGILFKILETFNVNTMSRSSLWNGIKNEYFFSPLFFGRGMGFTSKWMDNNWQTLNIIGLTGTTGLHSDLLKYYIDFGFSGFIVFMFWNLKSVTIRIKKTLDEKAAFVYFLLMLLQVLCWFTDNVSAFHIFMFPFYMIVFCLVSDVRGAVYERTIQKQNCCRN